MIAQTANNNYAFFFLTKGVLHLQNCCRALKKDF